MSNPGVFPLTSVGEPLKNTGNAPGAYYVHWGRFMEMPLGCIGCPKCGGMILVHLPDSGAPDRYIPTAGNLFTGEGLSFDRPVSHEASHSCRATYTVKDGSLVELSDTPNTRPVLFLDIDGVLNHDAQREARKRIPIEYRGESDWIDPVCVARVQAICDRTGAVIVLSSSWREMVGFERTIKVLRAKGLTTEVIGQTPTSVPAGKWLVVALTRWQEIQAWLESHPEVTRYVVLDDDAPGAPEGVYVCTKFSEGITDAHVECAVIRLTTPKSVAEELFSSPEFDDRVQYAPGYDPTDEPDPSEGFNPDEMYFSQGEGESDPNDCGCSMCCGTHVVVNCMGVQRPCDYCDCDIT